MVVCRSLGHSSTSSLDSYQAVIMSSSSINSEQGQVLQIAGTFLVRGADDTKHHKHNPTSTTESSSSSTTANTSNEEIIVSRVLLSNTPLSFWGGIDPESGRIVDVTHDLHNELVTNTILCLPASRGSCTASQVLLELILNTTTIDDNDNNKTSLAPRAIVLRDVDGLVCVGALIAQEILFRDKPNTSVQGSATPDIVHVGDNGFTDLLQQQTKSADSCFGTILTNGTLLVGTSPEEVEESASRWMESRSSANERIATEDSSIFSYSSQESQLLQEASSKAEEMALGVLFRYAHLVTSGPRSVSIDSHSDASPTYVPISSAHIDGCTYIGKGGLEFVRQLVAANGTVKVPTTLNAVSTDRQRWQQLGVPIDYATNAIALGDAYLELGCQPSFTCAPYLETVSVRIPQLGQDIAWGESNAVVYSNSVLGARTEKYADYLDICCAIAGMVPAVGVHLMENRKPHIILDATQILKDLDATPEQHILQTDLLYPILGHACGTLSDGKVPILIGLEEWKDRVTNDNLKAFCAAFGTTGSSPLIHIAGITPEAKDKGTVDKLLSGCDARVAVTMAFLERTYKMLDSDGASTSDRVDLIALGNPHLSISECAQLENLVAETEQLKKHPNVRVIACLSRTIYEEARERGHIQTLEAFGMEFVNDTCWCMLLDPPVIPANPNATIMTNSGKYSHYGPGLTDRKFRFGSMRDCIQSATTGIFARTRNYSTVPVNSRQQYLSRMNAFRAATRLLFRK